MIFDVLSSQFMIDRPTLQDLEHINKTHAPLKFLSYEHDEFQYIKASRGGRLTLGEPVKLSYAFYSKEKVDNLEIFLSKVEHFAPKGSKNTFINNSGTHLFDKDAPVGYVYTSKVLVRMTIEDQVPEAKIVLIDSVKNIHVSKNFHTRSLKTL